EMRFHSHKFRRGERDGRKAVPLKLRNRAWKISGMGTQSTPGKPDPICNSWKESAYNLSANQIRFALPCHPRGDPRFPLAGKGIAAARQFALSNPSSFLGQAVVDQFSS